MHAPVRKVGMDATFELGGVQANHHQYDKVGADASVGHQVFHAGVVLRARLRLRMPRPCGAGRRLRCDGGCWQILGLLVPFCCECLFVSVCLAFANSPPLIRGLFLGPRA